MENPLLDLHEDDKKLEQRYQMILKKSNITEIDSSSDTDDEPDVEHEHFQVDVFFDLLQYKFDELLQNPQSVLYLQINIPKQSIKIRVTSVKLEIGSNCCLIVSIGFNCTKIKNKKKLLDSDIGIHSLDLNTRHTSKLMKITNDIIDDLDTQELVVYNSEQTDKKRVSFTIVSDLNMDDNSLLFKIGYLDYYFK